MWKVGEMRQNLEREREREIERERGRQTERDVHKERLSKIENRKRICKTKTKKERKN